MNRYILITKKCLAMHTNLINFMAYIPVLVKKLFKSGTKLMF